ncbi:MAG: IS3 family transposase [Tissierellia bacterium]|nr:IS3 family transposase [Tissierellia bacterium]
MDEDNLIPISSLCRLAEVAKSGYYSWLKRDTYPNTKEENDLADFQLILEAYSFKGYDKGVMGIYMRLLRMGIRINHKKIRRLMRKYGLKCPIRRVNPYRQMAKAMKTNLIADNLLKREFKQHGPRSVLLTDITYLPFNGKFCYLSVIKDAYTNEILAHKLSESLEVDFVLITVNQLMEKHKDEISSDALIHSDQGSHYTSVSFRELINDYELRQSMSRRGNCWDNAPQESFFGHMKEELKKYQPSWTTFEDIEHRVDDWINYYNNDRLQLSLKKMSPSEFYEYSKK